MGLLAAAAGMVTKGPSEFGQLVGWYKLEMDAIGACFHWWCFLFMKRNRYSSGVIIGALLMGVLNFRHEYHGY